MNNKRPAHDLSAHIERLRNHPLHISPVPDQSAQGCGQRFAGQGMIVAHRLGESGQTIDHKQQRRRDRHGQVRPAHDHQIGGLHGLMSDRVGKGKLSERIVQPAVHLRGQQPGVLRVRGALAGAKRFDLKLT